MSIPAIGGMSVPRPGHPPSAQASKGATTGQAAASGAAASIINTGSVSARDSAAFFKSFSADLQSTLRQTAANQPMNGVSHHRHPRGDRGSGSAPNAAVPPTATAGLDAATPAADPKRAARAYGSTASLTG